MSSGFISIDYEFYFIVIFRLLLACILGGLIGYERENMNRPAGFRTLSVAKTPSPGMVKPIYYTQPNLYKRIEMYMNKTK